MSKGTKTSNEPWKESKPYLLGAANTLNDAYNQNAGGLQKATDQVTSLLPSVIDKYKQGNPALNAATSYAQDVLGGKYLNNNPHLQAMLDRTNNDVMNSTMASLSKRGLTGGSDYARLIADRVAANEGNIRFADYNNERQAMGQAASLSPSIAAADTIQIQPMMSMLNAYQTPMNAAGNYAQSLGGLLGGYQTQKSGQSTGSAIASGIGTIASIASLFSDARLKEDIRRVGQTDGGLPVYTFRYKGEPAVHMGVMAQDVEVMQPEALGPVVSGFKTVNYGGLV